MSKRRAVLQVADTGPLESLVIMLRKVGWDCHIPSNDLKRYWRSLECDTVLDIEDLVKSWGYDPPMRLPEASLSDFKANKFDLFVDVKAHRNGPLVWAKHPYYQNKTLWYRINGGKPEHVIRRHEDGSVREDCGDEINPPCPILTPNLWYQVETFEDLCDSKSVKPCPVKVPWYGRSYSCWPPFYRFDEYQYDRPKWRTTYNPALCLIHNVRGWGYEKLIEPMRDIGVRCYGNGSPDGLLPHREIAARLSTAIAMVHLKSSDAPGYALLEALAAACPVVCTRRLIWRNRMQELLIPGETCLVFDRETHDGLTEEDIKTCTREVQEALFHLADPDENRRIGMNGRNKLRQVMWNEGNPADVATLAAFMEKHFG